MDDFFVVPADPEHWSSYERLYCEQYGSHPMRHDKTLLIGTGVLGQEVAAGCVLIATDGPYVLADSYVINPRLEKIQQYNVTAFFQRELAIMASILNRVVVMIVNHPGLRAVLEKHGYELSKSELWSFAPGNPVEHPAYLALRPLKENVVAVPRAVDAETLKNGTWTDVPTVQETFSNELCEEGRIPKPSKWSLEEYANAGGLAPTQYPNLPEKRKRGRPKGSVNKAKQ